MYSILLWTLACFSMGATLGTGGTQGTCSTPPIPGLLRKSRLQAPLMFEGSEQHSSCPGSHQVPAYLPGGGWGGTYTDHTHDGGGD